MVIIPDNPFRHNYVFTEFDKLRETLHPDLAERIRLWFRPTYVQIEEGTVYFFKVMDGKYWLLKYVPLGEKL